GAARDGVGDAPPRPQLLAVDAPVDVEVVDDEDAQAGERGGRRRRLRVDDVLTLEADLDPERAPDAGLAREPQLPAHERAQLAADREPEAGAAVTPRRRAVGLREALEDRGLAILADADPGVAHGEAEPDVRRARREDLGLERHAARLRELHGIADEVREHLPQAH